MTRPSPDDPATSSPCPRAGRPGTIWGFVFAPGIAALAGIVALFAYAAQQDWPDVGRAAASSLLYLGPVTVLGYTTAVVLAVPVYLLCSEGMRSSFLIVVPLAGTVAAAPWWCVSDLWRGDRSYVAVVTNPFALGVVGGAAFWAIRRWAPSAFPDPDA